MRAAVAIHRSCMGALPQGGFVELEADARQSARIHTAAQQLGSWISTSIYQHGFFPKIRLGAPYRFVWSWSICARDTEVAEQARLRKTDHRVIC